MLQVLLKQNDKYDKQCMRGIWRKDIKRETNLPDNVVTKALSSLEGKQLIKVVVNCQNKAKKHYMASEFC